MKIGYSEFIRFYKVHNPVDWMIPGLVVKEDGVWVSVPSARIYLTAEERSGLTAHPKQDLSKPALAFPATREQVDEFFDFYGFPQERIELPLIYQEYSVDEITNRWTRFYIHQLPKRLQERNQIAAMLVEEIEAGRLHGEPVLYYQHQPFSKPHKTQMESGWLTYTVIGGDLRRYEEERFGTDSRLDEDEQPYFGMGKRNLMKQFGEVRKNAHSAGVDQSKFIKAWVKLGMPMYWKADGIYCQSASSDVFYKLSGFYRVVHGHGVGIADLIEMFSEQPVGWGDINVIYCGRVQSVVGLDERKEFIPSITADKIYMLDDDIRKLEVSFGEEFYFHHRHQEVEPAPENKLEPFKGQRIKKAEKIINALRLEAKEEYEPAVTGHVEILRELILRRFKGKPDVSQIVTLLQLHDIKLPPTEKTIREIMKQCFPEI